MRTPLFICALVAFLHCCSAFVSLAPFASKTSRFVANDPYYLCPRRSAFVLFSSATASDDEEDKLLPTKPSILVLGGNGFLGSAICSRLGELGISHVAPSHDELDITASDVELKIADICLKNACTSVISTVGSINSPDDEIVNAASGKAAVGARMGGASKFVFIGNDDSVRELSQSIPFLKGYAAGKEQAEAKIRETFGPSDYCIVQPTFIYGGDSFGMNPPRIASSVGQIADELLGLYPVQAIADALPGVLGVALSPPVSRERVASAAVNAALGLNGDKVTLAGTDIVSVAPRRPSKRLLGAIEPEDLAREESAPDAGYDENKSSQRRQELKRRLFSLGPDGQDEAAQILTELENSLPSSVRPVDDPSLNDRWDFVFDIEADIGTGVIRKLIEDPPPILAPAFQLNDVRMEITDNKRIDIIVATKVVNRECDLVLSTNLIPDESDVDGTMVLEQFEGIRIGDMQLPVPESWKRSRPLSISYLDEDMIIAAAGNEPHFLLRDKS